MPKRADNRLMAFSTLSPEARLALADRQLAALAARESVVKAFATLDVAAARRHLGAAATGPLAGLLFGVKDIFLTADFATRCGFAEGEVGPRHDAHVIAAARRLGAILLGKTVCTPFAYPKPGPTTNPHDATRSPGGSSMGSPAAVAAGFVSFAFGSQTAGSTIRPASYCGVVGFKPSFGLIGTEGMHAISTTLDHVGLFTTTPRDAWYVTSALMFAEAEILAPRKPSRALVFRLPAVLPQADGYPERMAALAAALRRDGIAVEVVDLPFPLHDFRDLQKELCYWEAARLLLDRGPIPVLPELRALLEPYRQADLARYAAARERRQAYQAAFARLLGADDIALMPAATGAAPPLVETGDAVMNRFWTALHVPVMTVPIWRSAEGLPLGLQMIGRLGGDRRLCEAAQWVMEWGSVTEAAGRSFTPAIPA